MITKLAKALPWTPPERDLGFLKTRALQKRSQRLMWYHSGPVAGADILSVFDRVPNYGKDGLYISYDNRDYMRNKFGKNTYSFIVNGNYIQTDETYPFHYGWIHRVDVRKAVKLGSGQVSSSDFFWREDVILSLVDFRQKVIKTGKDHSVKEAVNRWTLKFYGFQYQPNQKLTMAQLNFLKGRIQSYNKIPLSTD